MLELAGHPRAQLRDQGRGLQGRRHGHVHVPDVDGGRPRHAAVVQRGRVVQARPLPLGDQFRHLPPGPQRRVLLEELGAHVLAGQQRGVRLEAGGPDPLRRPAGPGAVGPAGLVEDGVQRIAPAEGQHPAQIAAEGPRARVALQKVVEGVHAAARPQAGAQRSQSLRPDDVARGGGERPGRRQLDQGREARAVAGVAGVELLAARPHGLERQGVDLVDRVADGGQAAGEQDALQALGVRRQVAGGAEAAEGLPQQAPALDPQPPAQVLAVLDDLVGPHVAEQPGRAGGVSPGVRPVDGRGGAGAALVEEDEPVVLQDRADPAQSRVGRGPGGLAPGPALEEEQRRPGGRVDGRRAALGQGDLAGVDAQGF